MTNRWLIFFFDVSQIALVQDLRQAPSTIEASKFGLAPTRVNSILIIVVLCNFDIECHDLVACIHLLLFFVFLFSLSDSIFLVSYLIFLSIRASHRCIVPRRHADVQGERESTDRRLITVVIIIICADSASIIAFLLGFKERELARG